jgi:hypothetical protein
VSYSSSSSHPLASLKSESEHHPEPSAVSTHRTNDDVPLSQPVPSHRESKSVEKLLVENLERVVELDEDDEFHGRRHAEAQMPLPQTPPPESPKFPSVDPPTSDPEHHPATVDNVDIGNTPPPASADPLQTNPEAETDFANTIISFTNNANGDPAVSDVEALREQLKRFKERFTGSETVNVS